MSISGTTILQIIFLSQKAFRYLRYSFVLEPSPKKETELTPGVFSFSQQAEEQQNVPESSDSTLAAAQELEAAGDENRNARIQGLLQARQILESLPFMDQLRPPPSNVINANSTGSSVNQFSYLY